MNIEWFKNFTEEEQQDLADLLKNRFIVDSFLKVISKLQEEEERIELSLSVYESPSWACKQADLNGARRAYTKIRKLFE